MNAQLGLFSNDETIRERFEKFHAENPHVFEALRRRALRAKARGYRPGIGCLFEVLRWQHGMTTQGDEFKLNNNFRSHYARLLMEREPELEGFFETRGLRAA
ncbi:MAG: hypothetical protein ACU85V_20420 [Gammaproteobacteria bacterium]